MTIIRLLVVCINLFSKVYLPHYETDVSNVLVSVLIPARNESVQIPVLLDSLLEQTYVNIEVVVYNDQSTDETRNVVEKYCAKDKRVKLIDGGNPPVGWTGKNHACHHLAKNANGAYLLFVDADVWLARDTIHNAVGHAAGKNLDLLSFFPHQIMKTYGERFTVPLMDWILLSFLPLCTISKWKKSVFSAANGQFMMFRADAYHKNQWHNLVKNKMVEDIAINRLMKKRRYLTQTLLGNKDVFCRMYHNYHEGLCGFSKNIIQVLMGSVCSLLILSVYFLSGLPLAYYYAPAEIFFLYLGLGVFIKATTSYLSKQAVLLNVLLHIPQLISLIVIDILAIRNRLRKAYPWKGRMVC
jgi:chlorobactene glucosyltransferase